MKLSKSAVQRHSLLYVGYLILRFHWSSHEHSRPYQSTPTQVTSPPMHSFHSHRHCVCTSVHVPSAQSNTTQRSVTNKPTSKCRKSHVRKQNDSRGSSGLPLNPPSAWLFVLKEGPHACVSQKSPHNWLCKTVQCILEHHFRLEWQWSAAKWQSCFDFVCIPKWVGVCIRVDPVITWETKQEFSRTPFLLSVCKHLCRSAQISVGRHPRMCCSSPKMVRTAGLHVPQWWLPAHHANT